MSYSCSDQRLSLLDHVDILAAPAAPGIHDFEVRKNNAEQQRRHPEADGSGNKQLLVAKKDDSILDAVDSGGKANRADEKHK